MCSRNRQSHSCHQGTSLLWGFRDAMTGLRPWIKKTLLSHPFSSVSHLSSLPIPSALPLSLLLPWGMTADCVAMSPWAFAVVSKPACAEYSSLSRVPAMGRMCQVPVSFSNGMQSQYQDTFCSYQSWESLCIMFTLNGGSNRLNWSGNPFHSRGTHVCTHVCVCLCVFI